ncbi:MAG: hypothetical protein KDA85_14460 [Planctomycetaceae bacterium]|nr:hypothetical protein [Planctomycetaceae bacterium]
MRCPAFPGFLVACVMVGIGLTPLAGEARADLRDAAPADAYLAMYYHQNPERDYQKPYYDAVFATIQETAICDKIVQVIQRRMSGNDAEQFRQVRAELAAAVEGIEWEKLRSTSEVLYVQRMPVDPGQIPAAQHLLIAQIPDGGAASLHQGIVNLFRWTEQKAATEQVQVTQTTIAGVEITRLQLPVQSPFQPLVGVKDDLFVFGTNPDFCASALAQRNDPSADSKFDDPRCVDALSKLPEAEDSIVFFDGNQLFASMRQLGAFIRTVSNGNPEAARVAQLMDEVMSQMDVFDYEVAVEYTEGFQNRMASYGRVKSGAESTVLGQMMLKQAPFASWNSLVPASANGFALHSGANLHPLYVWVMEAVPNIFPELQPQLDRFAAIQDQIDLHLDEDILQSFSGEVASISMPGGTSLAGSSSSKSVLMLKCTNPERIQELLHRGFAKLQEIPQLRAYGFGTRDVPELEGFEEITVNLFAMVGIRPVYGFTDGWMVLGSSPDAVQAVLAVQDSPSESFAETERFAQFHLAIEGPVHSISYVNNAEQTRALANGMQQAGLMLPMVLQMVAVQSGNNAQVPDLTPVQDVLALLPSVGRIIGKLDFIQETLKVAQPGPDHGTYFRHSVTTIRPPQPEPTVQPTSN